MNKSPSETNGPTHAPVDIGLVLKLQQKLKDVEKEKGRLIRMVEDLERDSPEETSRMQDTFRVILCVLFINKIKRNNDIEINTF